MLNIVMMKWEPRVHWGRVPYTAEHVNNLVAAIDENLSMPVRYHLITDNPDGIDGGIKVHPIWDDGLLDKGACFVRLRLFSTEMRDLIGERFASVDLDAVVMRPLNPIFDRPEDFVIWRNVGVGCQYCGSMFMMNAGAKAEVWDTFNVDDLVIAPKGRFRKGGTGVVWRHPKAWAAGHVIGSDQAWISTVLGPYEAMWDENDGVMSFKRDIVKRGDMDRARIIFFHGREDPSMKLLQKQNPWIEENWKRNVTTES